MTRLFNSILTDYLIDEGQVEFHLKWGIKNETTWIPRNNVLEETSFI